MEDVVMQKKNKLGGRVFLWTVVVILTLTASLKIRTILQIPEALKARDPLFYFISNYSLLVMVSSVELACVAVIVFSRNYRFKLGCVAWSSTTFLLYRIGLLMIGYKNTCICLGLPQSWPNMVESVDPYLKLLLGYMTVGSYYFLLKSRRNAAMSQSAIVTNIPIT